jgi:two-component system response regulator AtoC
MIAEARTAHAPKKVILVVDDEQGMRDMLRLHLGEAGFEIKLARDGLEAKKLLAEGTVDLVITDLSMPNFDGFALLEYARGIKGAPIMIVTGFGTVEMAVHAMRLGAADFLLKPFDLGLLARRITEIIAP